MTPVPVLAPPVGEDYSASVFGDVMIGPYGTVSYPMFSDDDHDAIFTNTSTPLDVDPSPTSMPAGIGLGPIGHITQDRAQWQASRE